MGKHFILLAGMPRFEWNLYATTLIPYQKLKSTTFRNQNVSKDPLFCGVNNQKSAAFSLYQKISITLSTYQEFTGLSIRFRILLRIFLYIITKGFLILLMRNHTPVTVSFKIFIHFHIHTFTQCKNSKGNNLNTQVVAKKCRLFYEKSNMSLQVCLDMVCDVQEV